MYIDGIEVKRIESYSDYAVSKCGRAFRVDTKRELKIVQYGGTEGSRYLSFRVSENGKPANMYLHKAIAEAWINRDSHLKTEVNHIDGNKLNPSIDNLEWVTKSENQRHAIKTGLKQSGEDLYNASLSNKEVEEICESLMNNPKDINRLAYKYGTSRDVIRKIRSGSTYFDIRCLYDIPWDTNPSIRDEKTILEIKGLLDDGYSDKAISDKYKDLGATPIGIKRIRYGIDFKNIHNKDQRSTTSRKA